jgi:hypothetical protein
VVDSLEQIAEHRADIGDAVERSIDAGVAQRLGVDVGEDDIGKAAVAQQQDGMQSSGPASAPDIDDGERCCGGHAGDRVTQRARESIGIRSEEHAVGRLGRKR